MTDEEFLVCEIAEALHISFYAVVNDMLYEEFKLWLEYLKKRPIGWRDDLRAYTVIKMTSFGEIKAKPSEIFPSLQEITNDKALAFKKSKMYSFMRNSVGGDKVPWESSSS